MCKCQKMKATKQKKALHKKAYLKAMNPKVAPTPTKEPYHGGKKKVSFIASSSKKMNGFKNNKFKYYKGATSVM